ncbi:MAG: B12-binding domain-containing radical SAM protein [Candidatus Hydrogenedentes bacterium]|nr:B12-binding domain-containing radical SAM protein [Candidatus Hydrogenedentota bacterium]
MNILLISPASGNWRGLGRERRGRGRTFRFSMLSLLTVAALTPKSAKVRIVDEQVEEVPEDESFDLVGITAMTATAPRAYELCRRFRAKGTPVVLGGFHPTLNTAEALEHADAVVMGSAFGAWPKLVEDFEAGRMDRVYYGDPAAPVPATLPRGLMKQRRYLTVNATYATLGCRNRCRFCTITQFHRGCRYTRPVSEVVAEVASFRGRFFIFVDDNLTQDRDYVVELLTRLIPLRKRWITQASIEIADDQELLKLLRASGCVGLFVGLESFSERALCSQEKLVNAPARYRAAVAKLHDHGIFVESGIIFGFDTDGPEVFGLTLEMLDEIGIDAIQVSILTPVPGTPLFKDMESRIVDRNWEHYDYRHVVFTPARMTPQELQAGADWVIRRYYSPGRILKRLPRWLRMPGGYTRFVYPLFLNLAYWQRVKDFLIRGYNPAANSVQEAPASLEATLHLEISGRATCGVRWP